MLEIARKNVPERLCFEENCFAFGGIGCYNMIALERAGYDVPKHLFLIRKRNRPRRKVRPLLLPGGLPLCGE